MDPIIGIDLGTTNSEVAALVGGKVQVLAAPDGEQIMPSCVALAADDALLVGTPARNQYGLFPERTVKSIKRLMGSDRRIRLGDREYTPPEISAIILRTLKQRAEAALGAPVRRAVITVPAYFSDAQRQATRDAGDIAGLEVVRILNEPTAAALAYGADRSGDRTVLVYDLGGGTFDVSLVQVQGDVTEVLASHGNNRLGGDDFDQVLLDHVASRFSTTAGVDVRKDPRARSRLLHAVEEAKKQLSFEPYARIREEYLAERDGVPLHLDLEVSREDYDPLVRRLLESTLDSVHQALTDAGKRPDQIDEILLVGGATRTPLVTELLVEATGLTPRQEVHPDLCVALGAAVLATRLAGHDVDRVLVDVSPYSFGPSYFGSLDGRPSPHCYHPIIPRNTALPATRTDSYATMVDNQHACEVNIYQGDDPNALNNLLVGRFHVEGLSRVPAGNEVLVRMELDLDGILRVSAIEKRTGLAKHITIERAMSAMSEADVTAARERMRELFGDAEPEDADELDDADIEEANVGDVDSEPPEMEATIPRGAPTKDTEREHRVRVSEARALLERAERLLPRMTPEDREEAQRLRLDVEDALKVGDWDRLRTQAGELADLLFYVEER
ncbi:MAG: heat-shock protein Hsp70 [Candidatus Rokuibacteriota bacterium]|nr:MAG: heat-shock protein Hsp70 [Candidatus Rokubacteria bacterium]